MEERTKIKNAWQGKEYERILDENGMPEYFTVYGNGKTSGLPEEVSGATLHSMIEEIVCQIGTLALGLMENDEDSRYSVKNFTKLAIRQIDEIMEPVGERIGFIEIIYRGIDGRPIDAYVPEPEI